MATNSIKLVIFDMAGTTVRDQKEVESCFAEAARQTGLRVSEERITAVQGWSKRFVFETLWSEQLPAAPAYDRQKLVEESYNCFRAILEHHYTTKPVEPTEGCREVFAWLREQGIAIALTTGFYRKVTDLILHRLGWDTGLNEHRIGTKDSLIQLSVAGDEVPNGRPAPDMIHRAMKLLNITNPQQIVNIGDTPSDLQSGARAGIRLNLGVTNGTHTRDQLTAYPHDYLLTSLKELPLVIQSAFQLV